MKFFFIKWVFIIKRRKLFYLTFSINTYLITTFFCYHFFYCHPFLFAQNFLFLLNILMNCTNTKKLKLIIKHKKRQSNFKLCNLQLKILKYIMLSIKYLSFQKFPIYWLIRIFTLNNTTVTHPKIIRIAQTYHR